MKNLFISDLDQKNVDHFTSNFGLKVRKDMDKPFKKICNFFTKANIIRCSNDTNLTDNEYFSNINTNYIEPSFYNLKKDKNNIVLERYPKLDKNESYIFVCNHTCPEDIETILNIVDRNAYLILGSIESLKYNPEMYLSWLNGMIPFDILDKKQRKNLMPKMERTLKTNSILIFPEGSHNYSPNKLINNLFDGPVNLALNTGKKIVAVTLLRDNDNNVSYIDVSNPIDVRELGTKKQVASEKEFVNNKSIALRDKMATAVYYMMMRHFPIIKRENYDNIEFYFKDKKVKDAFKKLKWDHDVFDAEYLVKKTNTEKDYEDVAKTISNLELNSKVLKTTQLNLRDYVLKNKAIEDKNVADYMRNYWKNNVSNTKKLVKRK
jgi:hypothetical protein